MLIAIRSGTSLQRSSFWVEHTYDVLREIDLLDSATREIQVASAGYYSTGNEKLPAIMLQTEGNIHLHIAALKKLTADNAVQQHRIDSVVALTSVYLTEMHKHVAQVLKTGMNHPLAIAVIKPAEKQIHQLTYRLKREEQRLLLARKNANDNSITGSDRILYVLLGFLAVLCLLIFLSIRYNFRMQHSISRHNNELEDKLKEISDYQYAIDESSIVSLTDKFGVIKHVNDNFCKISKFGKNELLGQDHRILNSGYHTREFFTNLWTTISKGVIWRGEIKNKAKDGTFYWVETTIVPFVDTAGVPYQFASIRYDITARKNSEEIEILNAALNDQIRNKTNELASIFERITDGFIMLDKNFICTYANRRIGEMTGRDAATILGQNIWDVFPGAIGSETYNFFNKAWQEQTYQFHIDYNPEFDLWQENYIYPSPEGLSIFVRDITLQKRAEEKLIKSERLYKAVVTHIPGSLICLLDKDLRYFMIEGDLLGRLGYKREQLLGKTMGESVPSQRSSELIPQLERVFKGESFNIDRRQGDLDYTTRFVPIKDDDDKVYAAMLLLIDVTDLKQAERNVAELNAGLELKINKRTEQLAESNRELEAFSYSVAHDLRTPLRAVAGYSNMLVEDYGGQFDAEGLRLLAELQFNNKKMSQLIDDLLTFSRLGRKALKKSEVDMNTLVASALSEIPETSATIVADNLLPVVCDGNLMKHVMINLLSNAVKYSSKNKFPKIEMASESKDGMIIYSIKDNGVGFDMAFASQLFGVFQRLHSDEDFDGTGVGLAIVQRIITRHGGRAWAYSEINKGATFFFSLPNDVRELTNEFENENEKLAAP